MRKPLFLFGAPRSGSTFLASILNAHPRIHLTNEARIFVLFQHIVATLAHDDRFVAKEYQSLFLARLPGQLRSMSDRLYFDHAHGEGKDVAKLLWFGEKYPHYADPLEDGGRNRGCLELIERIYPDARYIHVHRHPFQSVASIVRKGWLPLEDASLVWQATSSEAVRFCARSGERALSVAWWSLCARPACEADRLSRLLELEDADLLMRELCRNADEPLAVSDPVTNPLADQDRLPLSAEERETVWDIVGETASALGYLAGSAAPAGHGV